MAASDIRGPSDNNNMLLSLTRSVNHAMASRSIIQKIQPMLCSSFKNNLYTTPVVSNKQNLPQLPVPSLNDTLEKYLRSVVPLLSEAELKTTTQLVKEFGKKNGIGEKLQMLLMEKAKKTENWLGEWWLNNAYLGYRLPVVVHSSPGLVFPLQKFHNDNERLDYASKLIVTAMKYKNEIDNDKIPLEKMGKDPLDMGQYKKFFGTCRIPKRNLDGLEFNPNSNYIIVACNNHFFKLYPINENKEILSETQIINQLQKIMAAANTRAPAIGILSSDNRDTWAVSYEKLIKDPQNAKSVEAIQKSLFLVCLDGPMPQMDTVNRLTVAGAQCIHGGGSKGNGGNRWFDKTVQFIIGTDGIVGLTYEHSPSEGQPIAVMTDFLVNHMNDIPMPTVQSGVRDFEQLKFNVDSELNEAIKHSGSTLDKLVNDFDLECHVFTSYGKNFVKSQKMSPDSFIQMAMQFSYYRLHNKPAPHYESAATRKYIGGRTETIRSCSIESIAFAKAMLDTKLSANEKRKYMMDAVNGHKKYTMDAVNGFGVDRHLMGLKLIALENGINLPEFYKDKAFNCSNHFLLTSSQVATQCPGFMCYGAVVEDGYALCYNPRNDNMYYGVSCFNSNKTTKAIELKKAFENSLKDMHDVLVKSLPAKL